MNYSSYLIYIVYFLFTIFYSPNLAFIAFFITVFSSIFSVFEDGAIIKSKFIFPGFQLKRVLGLEEKIRIAQDVKENLLKAPGYSGVVTEKDLSYTKIMEITNNCSSKSCIAEEIEKVFAAVKLVKFPPEGSKKLGGGVDFSSIINAFSDFFGEHYLQIIVVGGGIVIIGVIAARI